MPRSGALVGLHIQDAFAVQQDVALRHLVMGMPGDHIGKGGLARSVRPHHCVNLSAVQRQIHALQDFGVSDSCVQILNFKRAHILSSLLV